MDEPRLQFEYNSTQNKFQPAVINYLKANNTVRRSKKLADIDTHMFINDILLPKKDKPDIQSILTHEDNFNHKEKYDNENSHTYKVTEDISIEDVPKQEELVLEKTGYEYNPQDRQNFTDSLSKYLSKYNIKDSATLQNYALSRRPKAKRPVKQNLLLKPPHFQVPIRYNSLNHMPVNPLLAVFLSNYGYYLQGQYGIQNDYNNLYGYLASNNIHNNKPFGFYKLFSDTDSSNK